MANTITLSLSDRAASAFGHLEAAGIDAAALVEDMLVAEADRVQQSAHQAANALLHQQQQTMLDGVRDLPVQVGFVRPPR